MEQDRDSNESIRSIAVKLLETKLKNETHGNGNSRGLFILGSKQSGKTTLVNMLLEKSDQQIETLGLEYTFGRKNIHGHIADRNLCHVWELGGEMFKTPEIMKVPFHAHGQSPMTIILCLDLSLPKSIWLTLDYYISTLRSVIEKNENSGPLSVQKEYENSKRKQNNLFPTPLLIVGGKYDLFNNLDSGIKKYVCRMLRSVSLFLGGNLVFFSENDQTLKKKMKDILSHLGFGTDLKMKGVINDHNKPITIMSGNDTWESIGVHEPTWDIIKTAYTTKLPQTQTETTIPDDPSLEANFREPLIDSLRNEKDEELKILSSKSIHTTFLRF